MSLDKKYNIPGETVKRMIKDGVISCSIDRDYKIFDQCLSCKNANPSMSMAEVISQVAEDLKIHEATVNRAWYTIKKL